MSRGFVGRVVVAVISAASLLPGIAFSQTQTLGPGCRAATPQDQLQMIARGLPRAYQVCPGDTAATGVGQNFEAWYARLKTMSPCNRNTCTLSCRTRNTGAMVCSGTSRRWSSIGCHPNNNTAIFPTVAHGFAAHIELLRRYCGGQGRCTILSITQKWATANQGPYAAFVSRAAGIPYNQVFNPNDIDLVGRLALAMSCFEAGALPYSAQELKQGLLMAAGGAMVPVPSNVGELLNQSLSQSFAPAAPVAPVTPFFGPQGPGASAANSAAPLPPPIQPVASSIAAAQLPPRVSVAEPESSKLVSDLLNSATLSVVPAALGIVVQPHELARGMQGLVSWTSVGMRRDACKVTVVTGGKEVFVGSGNEGTRPIKIGATSKAGELRFALRCFRADGQALEKNATARVK